MPPSEFHYPPVFHGTSVIWAPDPASNPSQWVLGEVMAPKNNSCDILVRLPNGDQRRYDCLHADDPRCVSQPSIHRESTRGVFRLSQREIETRKVMEEFSELRRRVSVLEGERDAFIPQPFQAKQVQPAAQPTVQSQSKLPDPKMFRSNRAATAAPQSLEI